MSLETQTRIDNYEPVIAGDELVEDLDKSVAEMLAEFDNELSGAIGEVALIDIELDEDILDDSDEESEGEEE